MKTIFAGTPEFAATALAALLEAGFDIPLVLTQPDRPKGRGMQMQASAIKQLAQTRHIPVLQPPSLRLDGPHQDAALAACRQLEHLKPDVMVVAAYGLILPPWMLVLPRLGCVNIHASLLPKWRGAAPIQRAIEAGDTETGISIMQMEEGLDTGPVLMQQALAIAPDDTASTLHDKLASLGGEMICRALEALKENSLHPRPQDHNLASYAAKIMKNEARLEFSLPAAAVAAKIRALNPFPGAQAAFGNTLLKIWNAEPLPATAPLAAGKIVAANANEGVLVACQGSLLRITELQKPGGKRLPAHEFIRGFPLENGQFS
ncbi:MAG: methionyl-tRNA formyltransferase [Alistipes senegalensis]|nr:methionyl-tRNA formyltransferase [Oxalobacter formigenes]MCM1280628.1 methionyl-tRNA formyltransferase [Alistipes senegalensis]